MRRRTILFTTFSEWVCSASTRSVWSALSPDTAGKLSFKDLQEAALVGIKDFVNTSRADHRYSTGSVSDLSLDQLATDRGSGRLRSPYCTARRLSVPSKFFRRDVLRRQTLSLPAVSRATALQSFAIHSKLDAIALTL